MRTVRSERGRAANRPLLTMVVAAVTVGGLLSISGPSTADVTAVRGEAFGFRASVSLFGGPAMPRGPAPIVTLAPDASNSPQTASVAESIVQYGPAIIFSSGPITVSTQGTLGPAGSVTSSTDITNVNRSQQEVFTATRLQSTCTATEAGVSGSTTVTNGRLQTSEGNPNVEGDETFVNIPTNPPPNYTVNGTIEAVGDNFQAIFNEQIIDPATGALTVYAYHLRLLGPTAVGDVFVGKSECDVTGTGIGTTTTSSSTTTTSTTTTSTTTTSTTTTSTTTTSTTTTSTTTTSTTTTSTTTTSTTTTSTTTTSTTLPTTTTTRPATTTTGAATTCGGLAFTIVGTSGPDTIVGTPGPDVIFGGCGSDDIQSLGGDDTVCGGDGNDRIVGGDGNDRLFGDAGSDALFGGNGNDALTGGPQADQCNGEAGTDTASACEVITGLP